MVRHTAILGGLLLTLGVSTVLGSEVVSKLKYPRTNSCACMPNAEGYGYYRTTWRQWPGESHPEQVNPRSINAERLPTPPAQEPIPLPKTMVQKRRPAAEALPSFEDDAILPPPQPMPPLQMPLTMPEGSGGLLPSILPPQTPGGSLDLPAQPESGSPPPLAPPEGGLPGLPPEPDHSSMPGLPDANPTASEPNRKNSATGSRPTRNAKTATADSLGEVIPLGEIQEPERNDASLAVYRVDPIGAVPAELEQNKAAAYVTPDMPAQAEATDRKNSLPSIALGGYCPVALVSQGRWTRGDLRWTVVHGGSIYRLSGAAQRQQFLANPEAFAPACSGNDPVLAVEAGRTVPGQSAFCATYNGRLYMFSSAATQAEFNRNPQRYEAKK